LIISTAELLNTVRTLIKRESGQEKKERQIRGWKNAFTPEEMPKVGGCVTPPPASSFFVTLFPSFPPLIDERIVCSVVVGCALAGNPFNAGAAVVSLQGSPKFE
jgi:hypothetical protein